MSVLFIDIESTGLDPRVHVPWEVAAVEEDGTEHVWCWRPGLYWMTHASKQALDVGGFHERAPRVDDRAWELACAQAIARLTEGYILVGSKPSFDMEMLTPWLRDWGREPGWHHRPVCVATAAYGWLHQEFTEEAAEARDGDPWVTARAELLADLPWRSDDLSRACGVDPDGFDRHTALGDARWVRAWWQRITGGAA